MLLYNILFLFLFHSSQQKYDKFRQCIFQQMLIFSSHEQQSRIAIVLTLTFMDAINVKVFAKTFKTSLSNLVTDLIPFW